jgi:hypothetical protein
MIKLLPETDDERQILKYLIWAGIGKTIFDEAKYERKKEREEGVDWL